ncbi:MAG: hypothetical protein ACYC7F_01945, partial [Gemmatimonadaceae bacterium]
MTWIQPVRRRALCVAAALLMQQAIPAVAAAQRNAGGEATRQGDRRIPRRVVMPFVMGAAAA